MSIIRNVETIPVTYQEPNDAKSLRSLLFVRLETDDGVVGWGEGITQFPASTLATAVLVEDMKELLIGQSPIDNIRIFRQLQSKAWWYGYRGGLFNFALSAVDIALWDLRGQVTGQSLSSMIGRRTDLVGESLPALASTHVYQANLDEEVARHANMCARDLSASRLVWVRRVMRGSDMKSIEISHSSAPYAKRVDPTLGS